MFRFRISVFLIVVLVMGGTLLTLNGCGAITGGGSTKPAPPMIGKAFGAATIPVSLKRYPDTKPQLFSSLLRSPNRPGLPRSFTPFRTTVGFSDSLSG
jgi:hypothetical protein